MERQGEAKKTILSGRDLKPFLQRGRKKARSNSLLNKRGVSFTRKNLCSQFMEDLKLPVKPRLVNDSPLPSFCFSLNGTREILATGPNCAHSLCAPRDVIVLRHVQGPTKSAPTDVFSKVSL